MNGWIYSCRKKSYCKNGISLYMIFKKLNLILFKLNRRYNWYEIEEIIKF